MSYQKIDKSKNLSVSSTVNLFPCSICLEETNKNNLLRTKCNHYFHSECLFNWITTLPKQKEELECYDDVVPLTGPCPLCRTEIKQIFDLSEHENYKPVKRFTRFGFIYRPYFL